MSQKVKLGDVVRVDYVGRAEGKVFDTSMEKIAKEEGIFVEGREYKPLEFKVGTKGIIKGFNDALVGMEVGEVKDVSISPEEGYGFRNEKLVKKYSREMLKKQGVDLYPGVRLVINTPEGVLRAVVTQMDDNEVTLDFNHDLAGKTLEFKIYLREILSPQIE